MNIRMNQHFSVRKGVKPTTTKPLDSPLSSALPRKVSGSPTSPSAESPPNVSSNGGTLLERLRSHQKLEKQAADKSKSASKTSIAFRNDPKRKKLEEELYTSVKSLEKSREQLQLSPYFSPHKDCLSTTQIRANLQHDVRRKLSFKPESPGFSAQKSPAKNVESVEAKRLGDSVTGEAVDSAQSINQLQADEATQSINQPLMTPVKSRLPGISIGQRSPGKPMLLFSPSKGKLKEFVQTAAALHAEAVCEGVTSEVGATAKDAYTAQLVQPESSLKRKADYDRSEIKKRLEALSKASAVRREVSAQVAKVVDPTSEGQIPASLRFAHLTDPVPRPLPLPRAFKLYQELFTQLDVAIRHNRRQISYFEKIRDILQQTPGTYFKRSLEYEDLGVIKSILPEAFIFNVEKSTVPGLSSLSADKEQMAVFMRDDTKPDDAECFLSEASTSDLVRRRNKFHQALLDVVFREHAAFLASLTPPLVIANANINNWHPKFPLDSVPLPRPAKLPALSQPKIGLTPAEVFALQRNTTHHSLLPRHSDAFAVDIRPPQPTTAPAFNPILKKIDPAFLARVQANQAKREARIVTRDPQIDKRMKMVERLPVMCRIILNTFSSARKTIMTLPDVIKSLHSSMTHPKLGADEFQQHMDLLLELFSEQWLLQVSLKSLIYLQIKDSTVGLREIEATLQTETDRLKEL